MIFIRVLSVDNSDGVTKESIGDIPVGFPDMLGSPKQVAGIRGAGRSLVVDAETTLERVVARRTAGERRGIAVESKLQFRQGSLEIIKKIITLASAQKEHLNVLSIVRSQLGKRVILLCSVALCREHSLHELQVEVYTLLRFLQV